MLRAALGYVPHTGWAWEVLVAWEPDAIVIARTRRVVVTAFEDGALYHVAAELPRAEAADWLRDTEALAAEATRARVEVAIAEALALGCAVEAAAVVGKEGKALPLARILASHAAVHGAEGELWRRLFAEGAARCELRAIRVPPPVVDPTDPFLIAGGKRVGAPWGIEPKIAALAARAGIRLRGEAP